MIDPWLRTVRRGRPKERSVAHGRCITRHECDVTSAHLNLHAHCGIVRLRDVHKLRAQAQNLPPATGECNDREQGAAAPRATALHGDRRQRFTLLEQAARSRTLFPGHKGVDDGWHLCEGKGFLCGLPAGGGRGVRSGHGGCHSRRLRDLRTLYGRISARGRRPRPPHLYRRQATSLGRSGRSSSAPWNCESRMARKLAHNCSPIGCAEFGPT